MVEDCSKRVKAGDRLAVHYVGTLYKDDKEFDSSRKRETPLEFTLGRGEVVTGWDRGISGMCVGEIRKIVLPSDIAYGEAGALPDILPGATLVFEVELMEILWSADDYDNGGDDYDYDGGDDRYVGSYYGKDADRHEL